MVERLEVAEARERVGGAQPRPSPIKLGRKIIERPLKRDRVGACARPESGRVQKLSGVKGESETMVSKREVYFYLLCFAVCLSDQRTSNCSDGNV
jgi:hypothetical protein